MSDQSEDVPAAEGHTNGRLRDKPEEQPNRAGKWESLSVSSIHKEDPAVAEDVEEESQEIESEPVFAKPTLTPREMDTLLMPPPSLPGLPRSKYSGCGCCCF